MSRHARIPIGTSGWNYAGWRGRFYPDDLPALEWFEHYAGVFDPVEINHTFYHLARQCRARPPGCSIARGWLLGEVHDLAVFREVVTAKSDKPDVEGDLSGLIDLIDRRSEELRREARPLGERVFAEKPKRHTERFRKDWNVAGFAG